MSVSKIKSGFTRPGIKMSKMKKIILTGITILILSAVGYAYYLYHKPHQGISAEKPDYKIDAITLVGEYDKNEKAANEKYLGKVLEVKGVIAEMIKDEKGKYNITLMAEDLSGVGCEFENASQSFLHNLKEGQEVTIKGICTGVLMDVVLVDCVLSNQINN